MRGPDRCRTVHLATIHLHKHSQHSGYDRLVEYLPDAEVIRPPALRRTAPVAAALFARAVRPRARMLWYSVDSLLVEAATLGGLLSNRGHLYHFLYGEHQLWLATLLPGSRSKLVATFHQAGDWWRRAVGRPDQLRRLDGVIVVSGYQASFYAQYVGEERVHVVPHGVDTTFFRPGQDGAVLGRRPGSKPVCLTVSEWLRDLDTLGWVIDLLVSSYADEISFVVVSRSEQARSLGERSQVTLLSDLSESELLGWYQRAALLLLPLHDSTANNVVLESMACGTPIVTNNVGGIPEYLDQRCGVMAAHGDAERMAQAVTELLDDGKKLLDMSLAARRRALEFDWRWVAEATRSVYAEILRS
jgi:glycosyltransferase involved in cell wall biosynthesis